MIMAINKPYYSYQNPRSVGVSDETKNVIRLGQEIAQIKRETNYIKDHGVVPPKMPNFYKRLDTL